MQNFLNTPMLQVINILREKTSTLKPKEIVEFEVLNPDFSTSCYSGTVHTIDSHEYIYHSYKSWLDLAQILYCKMLTPLLHGEYSVIIRFQKLNADVSFHNSETLAEEKYGSTSIFSQIHKNEEPAFLAHYLKALENVKVESRLRILNLGVNSGDEFELIHKSIEDFSELELIGIDYCPSAIALAEEKFKDFSNISFYTHDINNLESLELGKFDLVISIGTLQSTNLSFNEVLMSVVQKHLKCDGAMILGFPNCRWIDGEMVYGARVKNYSFSELGLLYKDVVFSKKYLQQKRFRVTITGKDYIFITATSIR